MTVKELIEKLQEFNPSLDVYYVAETGDCDIDNIFETTGKPGCCDGVHIE